jgi:hypothetical protein
MQLMATVFLSNLTASYMGKKMKGLIRTDPASAEFFIEFKGSCEDDPFYFSQERQSAGPPEELDNRLPIPLNRSFSAYKTVGQIGTYIALQMDSQYRTHTFFVLIVGDYARLMRWDRSGAIFTEPINYNKESELVEFFKCYNAAPPEVQGSDKFVGQPLTEEISAAEKHFKFHKPLLAVSLHNNSQSPWCPNRYIIEAPSARPSLPIGRSTRTSIAYDVQRRRLVMMKDSWPVFVHDNMMEGRVYQQLNEALVQNTPICVDFSNGDECNSGTRTQHFTRESWLHEDLAFSVSVRRHHRLILDTVGRPLETFTSSKELVRAVRAAMIGMSLKRFAPASR